ncbi:Nucleoside diphosphate kinase [Chelonia mydas]|uniref:Nucleoside diphosphate kinase n=1 Tax=Chelonia mydas TaxID=8469 RepID=M7BLZ6_CHEMY|nr:Nucleoside diphosphate kinase [Chelonia mydas]
MSSLPSTPVLHQNEKRKPMGERQLFCRLSAVKTPRMMASICERTFIAIKPDGVQRGLVGEIIKRFEQKGFKLVAMKFMQASEDLLKEHYIDLKDRPFYAGLVKYMHSGPVVAMVWEGLNVIKTGRVMLGETNPADSKPGTIRGDFCVQVGRIMASHSERTFIAVKPDGVQRGLVGEIIKRFEQKGFRLVAMKFMHASENLLKQHYIDLKDRPFYPGLVKYMNSGPVVAMSSFSNLIDTDYEIDLDLCGEGLCFLAKVWEGLNVVKTGRVMLGETNPADSKPGTIRGDFCIQVGRNIIHGSDSVESAQKEINLWFQPTELVDFKSCAHDWIYE